ncbi:MAG: beta strand repeat-containing protein, partial [Lewinella sp.]
MNTIYYTPSFRKIFSFSASVFFLLTLLLPAETEAGSRLSLGSDKSDTISAWFWNYAVGNSISSAIENKEEVSNIRPEVNLFANEGLDDVVDENVLQTLVYKGFTKPISAPVKIIYPEVDKDMFTLDEDASATMLNVLQNDVLSCDNDFAAVNGTLTVEDTNGNTATRTATITTETAAPTITCPSNITQNAAAGTCSAAITVPAPTVASGVNFTVTNDFNGTADASGTYPVGITTVTFTVTDENSETDDCTFTVTVTGDDEAPTFGGGGFGGGVMNVGVQSNSSVTAFLNNNGFNATTYSSTPSASTLAGLDAYLLIRRSGNTDLANWVNNGGLLITEWSASDWALNTSNLIDADDTGGGGVGDGTLVTFTGTSIADQLSEGLGASYADAGRTGFFRNFSNIGSSVEIHATRPTNVPAIIGGNAGSGYVLIWGADWQDGFPTSPSPSGTLLLNALGLSSCVDDVTVNIDAGQCTAVVNFDHTAEVMDNCDAAPSLSYSTASGSAFPIGTTEVTITATDASANALSCTFEVTVEDNVAPVAICQNTTVTLGALGNGSIVAADVFNAGSSSDNCGTVSAESVSQSAFSCADIGAPTVVTLTVNDGNGNTNACTATVTVNNVDPPTFDNCQDIVVDVNPVTCTAVVNYTPPTFSSPCSGSGSTTLMDLMNNFTNDFADINAVISNQYNFSDGITGNNISDGGNDMYDGGNRLNTNIQTNINYANNSVISSSAFGSGGNYFTSKVTDGTGAMFMLGAEIDNLSYFEITGNNGADGGGNADGATFTSTINGTIYYGFLKRVYNASDPSINELIIVDQPGGTQTFSTNTDNGQHRVSGINSSTRLYYLLFAGSNGFFYDNTAVQTIMDQFLTTINPNSSQTSTLVSGPAPGSTFPLGSTPLSFLADDGIGNTNTCNINVVVNDPGGGCGVVCAPQININNVSLDEGTGSGTTSFNFTVITDNDCDNDLTVDYTIVPGTASANDFASTVGGTITFSGPSTSETITVNVNQDCEVEGSEDFTVVLSNPSGGTIVTGTGTGTITNDDTAPAITDCSGLSPIILDATNCTATVPDYTGAITATFNPTCASPSQSPIGTGLTISDIGPLSITFTIDDGVNTPATCSTIITVLAPEITVDNAAPGPDAVGSVVQTEDVTSTQTFTITNTGNAPLTLGDITVAGTGANAAEAVWTIVDGPTSGTELAINATATFKVN